MMLKTFASVGLIKKVKRTQNKVLQFKAERKPFLGQLVLFSVEHNIDLQVTFSYPLGPVPFSLATAEIIPVDTTLRLTSNQCPNLQISQCM